MKIIHAGLCLLGAICLGSPADGQVTVVGQKVILENAAEHLNFPFVHRFDDGTMWMNYSVGRHTVTERGAALWSRDNGATWAVPPVAISGMNAAALANGSILTAGAWNGVHATTHQINVDRHISSAGIVSSYRKPVVDLPWSSTLALHRSLVWAGDGSLVQSAYGMREAGGNSSVFTLRSSDNGTTWEYGGLVGYDPSAPANHGFTEPAIVKLADDTLLTLMRTGGPLGAGSDSGPLMQSKSSDHGVTWTAPVQVADFGVDPHVIQLQNGVLVASYGRPGVHVMVDVTGTGNAWEHVQISSATGSSYTSLIEYEPNKVMLVYDVSGFGNTNLPRGVPNRFYATYLDVVPEPAAMMPLGAGLLFLRRSRVKSVGSADGR